MRSRWLAVACLLALPALAQTVTLSDADKRALAEANKYATRGNQFAQSGSLQRAKAELDKAVKVFPRHLDALYNLTVVCAKLGQRKEAIEYCKKYLALAPNDADAWTQLGVLYDEGNHRADAVAAYEKAIAADPQFGRAYHNLGVALKEQGRLDEAERNLKQFMKLEEDAGRQTGEAYYSLGILHLQQGRVKDAKMLIQQALDVDPNVSFYNNALGDVYLLEMQPQLAVSSYTKAIEKDPQSPVAYSGLGDAYAQLGDAGKAATAYRKALQLRSDYALVHFKLARLFETSDPAEAIKQLESYLASGKNLQFADEAKAKLAVLKMSSQNPKP